MKRRTCSRIAVADGTTAYVFRGSEYGMCYHRHVASLRGLVEAPIDAKTRLMFDAGNTGEAVAKDFLHAAAIDSGLVVEEFATGWENQTSVTIKERRVVDDVAREVRLICSPDGRLSFDVMPFPYQWVVGGDAKGPPPRQWALEVKCYGESSIKKFKSKGPAAFPTLEWQTSGVAAGYAERLGEPVGVVVMVLRRDEHKDDEGKTIGYSVPTDQVPMLWLSNAPAYTPQQCIDRCWDIVNTYEQGDWPKCDNAYFCKFPHRQAPVLDSVAEAMLEALAEAHDRWRHAVRDVEGILVGRANGEAIGRYRVCRQLVSMPCVVPA